MPINLNYKSHAQLFSSTHLMGVFSSLLDSTSSPQWVLIDFPIYYSRDQKSNFEKFDPIFKVVHNFY